MRRASKAVASVIGLVVAGSAQVASAQTVPGYAADHLQPSERGSDWFTQDSLHYRGDGRVALGVVGSFAYRTLAFHDTGTTQSVLRTQTLLHFGGSFFIADRVRVAFNLPLQVESYGRDYSRGTFTYARPSDHVAIGDARLSADVRVVGRHDDAASLGFGAQLYVPSGSESAFTGWGDLRAEPHLLFAGRRKELQYSVKAGVMLSGRNDTYNHGEIGSELTGGAAIGYRFVHDKLLVGPEAIVSSSLDRLFEKSTTPVEGLLGVHYRVDDFRIGAGAGTRFSIGYGAPAVRGLLSFEWAPHGPSGELGKAADRDGDGVDDDVDACVYAAGPASKDPTLNGCPVADLDKDGIPDSQDTCPANAGNDPHRPGCPSDADHDGIPDALDACPYGSGTASPDRARNGCPSTKDTDGDGVVDAEDICPYTPGMRSTDPRATGCPTRPHADSDGDGVPDFDDKCPDVAGQGAPDSKKHGCPTVTISGKRLEILDEIKFATGSAVIAKGAPNDEILGGVAKILAAHKDIARIEVAGHTDNKGEANANLALSQARADAVAAWLAQHGVERTRLFPKGYGSTKPRDTSDSDAGRANNRRIEFNILEAGSPAPVAVHAAVTAPPSTAGSAGASAKPAAPAAAPAKPAAPAAAPAKPAAPAAAPAKPATPAATPAAPGTAKK